MLCLSHAKARSAHFTRDACLSWARIESNPAKPHSRPGDHWYVHWHSVSLSNTQQQPKSINVGKKNRRLPFNHCCLHMHEAEGPNSLAELRRPLESPVAESSLPTTPTFSSKHFPTSHVCSRPGHGRGCPRAVNVLEESDGLPPLKKLVTFRNIQPQCTCHGCM